MRKQIIKVLIGVKNLLRDKFDQYNLNLPFLITIFVALLIVVGGVNLFVDLTATLHTEALSKYDSKITQYIISFRTPTLNKIFQFITNVGDLYGYLVIAALSTVLFYWKFRNWRFVLEMIFVLVVSGLSNVALKQVINRARPDAEHLVSVATLSYPSGHAMSAMAFYGFLIFLFYNFKLNRWLKTLVITTLVLLILAIGISRIYLGVHYPSDIAGGYIAGFIWVIFCVVLFHVIDLLRKRRKRKKEIEQVE
ncbi:phosphatase PAP2 family protein [Antarcticibacterium sp. 1MA-6-2]|uniref:phosphatase PAP2 family protein n=1 Tax=Antarcticibacterium sp. 1MA-6-2 TaxID=2908210 RepID=UPI001F43F933|nr:phosphatase PAP2 family protein [Antarcticibacterium sp. 1MA-6-2]UJH91571.1 phosphatase PAP2 family protein [Antarcticibacterium sp. 1MA-6-2]